MVILGISDKCNFNCIFCLDRHIKGQGQPSLAELKEIFKTIAGGHEKEVMLMNGESLMRPDLWKIIGMAKEYGLTVRLTTNGSVLSSRPFLQRLVQQGIKHINISINSHLPSIANKIAGVPFCHSAQKKALANIDDLNKKLIPAEGPLTLTINTVVCSCNYKKLKDLSLYLKEQLPHTRYQLKFKCLSLDPGYHELFRKVAVPPLIVRPYLLEAFENTDPLILESSGFPLCAIPGYEWTCVELKEALIKKSIFFPMKSQCPFGSDHQNYRGQFYKYRQCSSCSLNNICFGTVSDYQPFFPARPLVAYSGKRPGSVVAAIIKMGLLQR